MTLISIDKAQQPVKDAFLDLRSGNFRGWRFPWSQRNGTEQAHNVGGVVCRCKCVSSSLLAFQFIETVDLGGSAGKHSDLILKAGENSKPKCSGSAPRGAC